MGKFIYKLGVLVFTFLFFVSESTAYARCISIGRLGVKVFQCNDMPYLEMNKNLENALRKVNFVDFNFPFFSKEKVFENRKLIKPRPIFPYRNPTEFFQLVYVCNE